ncbi:MAG: 50S ribosomal protein L29 [Planctomycetes bacterium]|nr:50S ribosomal protein L29 [Planctomycetota bacterium]
MKAAEVREKRLEELLQLREELTAKMFNLRYRAKTSPSENTRASRAARRDIARINLVLHERVLAAEEKKNSPEWRSRLARRAQARRDRARRPERGYRQIS